jgi:hypothetical protein
MPILLVSHLWCHWTNGGQHVMIHAHMQRPNDQWFNNQGRGQQQGEEWGPPSTQDWATARTMNDQCNDWTRQCNSNNRTTNDATTEVPTMQWQTKRAVVPWWIVMLLITIGRIIVVLSKLSTRQVLEFGQLSMITKREEWCASHVTTTPKYYGA